MSLFSYYSVLLGISYGNFMIKNTKLGKSKSIQQQKAEVKSSVNQIQWINLCFTEVFKGYQPVQLINCNCKNEERGRIERRTQKILKKAIYTCRSINKHLQVQQTIFAWKKAGGFKILNINQFRNKILFKKILNIEMLESFNRKLSNFYFRRHWDSKASIMHYQHINFRRDNKSLSGISFRTIQDRIPRHLKLKKQIEKIEETEEKEMAQKGQGPKNEKNVHQSQQIQTFMDEILKPIR